MDKFSQDVPQQRRKSSRLRGGYAFLFVAVTIALLTGCSGIPKANPLENKASTPRLVVTRTGVVTVFSQPITYVALGASDAVGVGSNKPGSQGYVPLIAARLPRGSHALNLGISGIRLHDALNAELPLALNTLPQLITIWLVANDFVDGVNRQSYLNDLTGLLHQLHTRTRARIVMANLPDLTRLPSFSNETASQKLRTMQSIVQWDQGIAQIATQNNVTLVNLLQDGSEITAHPEYISADGFHPSAQGYVRLAELFWQAIQAA